MGKFWVACALITCKQILYFLKSLTLNGYPIPKIQMVSSWLETQIIWVVGVQIKETYEVTVVLGYHEKITFKVN